MNNTGRRACQRKAARNASVAADDLVTITGDLPRLQPGAVTVSVSDRHSAADSTLSESECFRIIFQTKT